MNEADLTQRIIAASGPPATDDLTTFLRKRYLEARAAETGKRTIAGNLNVQWEHHFSHDEEYVLLNGHQRIDAQEFWEKYGTPSADPAVLADLDAKLAVLDELDRAVQKQAPTSYKNALLFVIQHLGVVYASHPDYKENWRP